MITVIDTIAEPVELTNNIVTVDLTDKQAIENLIQKLTDLNK